MVRSNTSVNPHNMLAVLSDIERRSQQEPMTGKRQFLRRSLRGEAILQTLEDAAVEVRTMRVQLRDISQTGIGFLASEPMESGTVWRVMFVVRNFAVGQQTITVRHSRPIAAGVYLCGGQFCIEPGMLHMMGIDPHTLCEGDGKEFVDGNAFLPPGETR